MSESLSQQVAALEAERDGYEREYHALKAVFATAQVEGAREAFVAGAQWMCERIAEMPSLYAMATGDTLRAHLRGGMQTYQGRTLREIAADIYPAAPRASEGEPCKHLDGPCECGPNGFGLSDDDPRVNRPTPQAAPEPFIVLPAAQSWTDDGQPRGGVTHHVHITPADARRIVQMGGGNA